jgi:hypothetical protein
MKKSSIDLPVITMTYAQLNNQYLVNVIQKFERAEVDNKTACRLRDLIKAVKPLIISMEQEYLENLQTPYKEALKAAGLDITKGKPKVEDIPADVMEKCKAIDAKLTQDQIEFSKQEVTFELVPLGPQHLSEIKVSALEIEALGPLFDEKGEVRQGHFQRTLNAIPDNSDSAS